MVHQPLPTVTVTELPPDVVLLDVREPDEWQAGHAEKAVHIPMSEVVTRIDEVPQGGTVHVVCKAGGRSAQVTQYLLGQGRDAVNVAGGMLAWEAAGRPVVTDGGTPGAVI